MQPPNHQMKYTARRKSSGLIFGLLVIRSSSWDPHLISRYCWASPGLLFNQRLFWSCFVNILVPNLRQDPSECLMSEPDAGNFGLSGREECFDIDTRNQILCHRHYSGEMWEIMQHPWPTIVITDWALLSWFVTPWVLSGILPWDASDLTRLHVVHFIIATQRGFEWHSWVLKWFQNMWGGIKEDKARSFCQPSYYQLFWCRQDSFFIIFLMKGAELWVVDVIHIRLALTKQNILLTPKLFLHVLMRVSQIWVVWRRIMRSCSQFPVWTRTTAAVTAALHAAACVPISLQRRDLRSEMSPARPWLPPL